MKSNVGFRYSYLPLTVTHSKGQDGAHFELGRYNGILTNIQAFSYCMPASLYTPVFFGDRDIKYFDEWIKINQISSINKQFQMF